MRQKKKISGLYKYKTNEQKEKLEEVEEEEKEEEKEQGGQERNNFDFTLLPLISNGRLLRLLEQSQDLETAINYGAIEWEREEEAFTSEDGDDAFEKLFQRGSLPGPADPMESSQSQEEEDSQPSSTVDSQSSNVDFEFNLEDPLAQPETSGKGERRIAARPLYHLTPSQEFPIQVLPTSSELIEKGTKLTKALMSGDMEWPVPEGSTEVTGKLKKRKRKTDEERERSEMKVMGREDLEQELFELRKKSREQEKLLNDMTEAPYASLRRYHEENIYLKECLSVHQLVKPIQEKEWRSKEWDHYQKLRGLEGEAVDTEIKMNMKPSVVKFFKSLKEGRESNGEILNGIFEDLARIEAAFRVGIDDLQTKIYNPTILEGSIKARVVTTFKNPFSWVRITAHGVSQQAIDFMRQFFPGVIIGHNAINSNKVKSHSLRPTELCITFHEQYRRS